MKPEELKPYVSFMKEHGLLVLSVEKPGLKIYLAREGAEKLVSAAAPRPSATAVSAVPAPGAAPFAEVGQDVKVGDVLCIVEAMKVMNQVKSEVNGRILEIKKENGKPVEFGETLFLVSRL